MADRHTDKGMSSWSCYMAMPSSNGLQYFQIKPRLARPGTACPLLPHLAGFWAGAFISCLHTCFALGLPSELPLQWS